MSQSSDGHLIRLGINLEKLEDEMNAAIAKDSRYWLENDAKIRAVQQGVPSYEDFRQLVAGCHLRPVDKSELINNQSSVRSSWNNYGAFHSTSSSNVNQVSHVKTTEVISPKQVNTPHEFLRQWRYISSSTRLSTTEKYTILVDLLFEQSSSNLLKQLFDTGLGVSLLPDLFIVMQNVLVASDEITPINNRNVNEQLLTKAINVLLNLTESKQFLVSINCLLDEEKQSAFDLLKKLKLLIEGLDPTSQQDSLTNAIKKILSLFGT